MYLVRKFYSPDPEENTVSGGEIKSKSDKKPEEKQEDVVSLAKALKEARENSVSKSEYDRVVAEKEKLVSEIINGGGAGNGQQATPEEVDIDQIKEKLYGPKCSELSNLEYWKLTLQLRDEVIKREGHDPFLPAGANIKPTELDAEKAEQVAKVVRECIEESEGDSGVFTALLQRRTNNDSPTMTAHLKKLGLI